MHLEITRLVSTALRRTLTKSRHHVERNTSPQFSKPPHSTLIRWESVWLGLLFQDPVSPL